MKLVGATPGFIRRPFILSNLVQGVIAGIIASGLLAALIGWGKNWDPAIESLLPWGAVAAIFGGVLILGMAICAVAAFFATNRYLHANYDDMFE
jgi:cell division transport system permease protein